MTDKMRVGIGGLGVASTIALPEIASHPHVEIVAGADPRSAAREAFAAQFQAATYRSVEEMCDSEHIDLVYILTPNRQHAEHAVIAAEHRKQVVLDKPIAVTLEEADRVITAAERNNVRVLVGHTQSLDPPIRRMSEIVNGGELGRVLTISTLFFSDWLYRPRSLEELDPAHGEGLIMRQGPVQADIVRMLGGGLVRSVRASSSAADPDRPIDGGYAAFAEFEHGAAAQMVYSGYGYFDSTDLTFGVGLQGYPSHADDHVRSHELIAGFNNQEAETAYKESTRYGGARHMSARSRSQPPIHARRHAFFGFTLVNCEKGDLRQTPTGLTLYSADGHKHIDVSAGENFSQRYTSAELNLMYAAWSNDAPLASHDARWGKASLEVCLAIIQSARERREIMLHHQVRV